MVDNTTHFYNLDYHDITFPTKVNNYPDVDFLELILPVISIFVKPSNTGSPLPKHKHMSEEPLRYLTIHLTASQCSFLGLKKKSTNNTNCMCDVKPHAHHGIHQTSYR